MAGRPERATRLAPVESVPAIPGGGFVDVDGEILYRISSYDRMNPFLMSIPSATDLWMFITSGGGLTAGRVDADGSLFPYLTVDQLHDAHHHTGPLTLVRVDRNEQAPVLWEPFSPTGTENPSVERNLYKNTIGNRLVFEEVHHELGLAFRYDWSACDEFGWVRSATLENRNSEPVAAALLDGLRNVLPHGASLPLYQQSSNLVDAYKKSEVDAATGLGLFSLTAGITDRAEAVERLRANTVWCCGPHGYRVHLSLEAVEAFRNGRVIPEQQVQNGVRGNYLVSFSLDLEPGESSRWYVAGDTGRDHAQIADLRNLILDDSELENRITEALRKADTILRREVASADGLQMSGHPESWTHHFANVLFNNMRGGVFAENYDVPVDDFVDFLGVRNSAIVDRHRPLLDSLPDPVSIQELRARAHETNDPDFERLCHEYLPLHFGRRHGDPSRPWNQFSIRVRNGSGQRVLNYQGNWRDIFQNWEALCTAFPGFLPNIVAKFVNASTVDGFNPYRINRDGVDWETASEDDPWSNIGYWGDHQIIYLLRLLESWDRHDPEAIPGLLAEEIYSYAAVPYRIKPYAEILQDPSSTILFDSARADEIENRVSWQGSDAKLLAGPDGSVYHVNLLEKLLVPALSKLSNLIPDAGIWMNTQRPEWNDANNALAGGGVSVVTLCHLRRYLAFLADLLNRTPDRSLAISAEIDAWFDEIADILEGELGLLAKDRLDPRDRKRLLDSLGEAFSSYRESVYDSGFTGRSEIPTRRVVRLCRTALCFIDWGLAANRREDGLFHTYNLLDFSADGSRVTVVRLQEMLEGQVAALSSGLLDPEESLKVLAQLYASDLYVPDQRSFVLYPERELPGFLDKNKVPEANAEAILLLRRLLAGEERSILIRDADGICRFHGDFGNAGHLETALDELALRDQWKNDVERDRDAVLDLFESVFRHRSYTGRSGTMYGYEGLGCIYWHMIAKLLLAVQETGQRAEQEELPGVVQEDLARMYLRIRSGIGYEKSVAKYGAFPTDPYSHTPPGGGAKQPGMTGQVKEEILTRRGELGICVENGSLRFQPTLLRSDEFLRQPGEFRYFDTAGNEATVPLLPDCLAFTLCQVPIVYELGNADRWIQVLYNDGSVADFSDNRLDPDSSDEIFGRSGRIQSVRVGVTADSLTRI
jgi:hypothetical protein